MLHFLLELLDVPREYFLRRNEILDSTFFCVRTQLQVSPRFLGNVMSLTQSFPCGSDKLVVDLHMLLSSVGTMVKPAYPLFAHRPNPIQEGSSNALSRIITRRHARSVEENRCILCIVRFNEIVGLITCKSVRFSQLAKRRSVSWIVAVVISM